CLSPACTSTTRSFMPTAMLSMQRRLPPVRTPPPCRRRSTQPDARISAITTARLKQTRSSPPASTSAGVGAAAANTGDAASAKRQGTNRTCFASAELAHALGRTDHIRQANPELVVDDDDLAVRDERAVDEHVERIAGGAVELDDRALVQRHEVPDRNARA